MTGQSLWYQTLFFVHSFSQYQDLRPVIHDDGSLRPEHVSELLRILPGARIHSDEEATARLDAHLPTSSFPCLRAHRLAYLHLRKITDVHAGNSEWRLFCDSDMLFFRRPDTLIDWLACPQRPIHAADVQRSYGYDIELLNSLAAQAVPDRINTGIIGMRGADIDWDFLEHLICELTVKRKSSYYLEQALTAILTAGRDPQRLPAEDYVVLPDREEALHPKAVLHHYVAQSKRWYFQHNWRVAQARLSAQ